jgi:translation initiation factor 2A
VGGVDGDRKNPRKRKGKKEGTGEKAVAAADPGKEDVQEKGDTEEAIQQVEEKVNGSEQHVPEEILLPLSPGADGSLDPVAKKVRNLNKKVCVLMC